MNVKGPALLTTLALVASFSIIGAVQATESIVELATAKACFTCHSIAPVADVKKPLAPSYQDIAARYHGDKSAHAMLVDRVQHGTVTKKQNWEGALSMRFMPPNVNTTRAEARELVSGILALKGDSPISDKIKKHENMLVLATTSSCMTCHNMSPLKKDVRAVPLAPSLRDIAAYYEGKEGAREHLIDSVKNGTMAKQKTWTNVNMQFMPANVATRDKDIENLVDWILTLEHSGIKAPNLAAN